jgi:hypothetical protein
MNLRGRFLIVALIAFAWPAVAWAEVRKEAQDVEGGKLLVYKLTVTPAAEPVPALRHRLVARDSDLKPGDAATMYYRAIKASEDLGKQFRDKYGDSYVNDYPWPDEPLASEKLRGAAQLIADSEMLKHLREAAARQDCDWGYDLRSIQGPDLYGFLLPEIQDARQVARHLSVLGRVAAHEQRYDDAIDAMRLHLKLARDVGTEPLLICGLVGIAIAGVGHDTTLELIGTPGSPNLYWALTELPNPLIDLRPAVRFEMSSLERVFPLLKDAETQEHSPEEWARLLAKGFESLQSLAGSTEAPAFFNETTTQMGVTGLGLLMYGPAKARLIAGGMDGARVEQMPVGQVMAVDAAHELRRIADDFEKMWYLPFAASRERDRAADDLFQGNKLADSYGKVLGGMFFPALSAARDAQERQGWQLDGIRTVEAIRMHAAETGELPRTLEEIKVVPAPTNRVTGKPYQYHLDGDTAVVELPFSDGFPGVAWRFKITLAD